MFTNSFFSQSGGSLCHGKICAHGPEWAQLSRVCAETQGGADTLEGQRALWPVCGMCVCVCVLCVYVCVFAGNILVLRQQTA